MSLDEYKTRETIMKEYRELPDIDSRRIIVISDYEHTENWHVEKQWFTDKFEFKRETVWHSPSKQKAIDYAKNSNKGKIPVSEGGTYGSNEHWYEVTMGYPFFDEMLRTWSKHAKTKNIPFDAKIRLIIYE